MIVGLFIIYLLAIGVIFLLGLLVVFGCLLIVLVFANMFGEMLNIHFEVHFRRFNTFIRLSINLIEISEI